jgi:hypothetical protein
MVDGGTLARNWERSFSVRNGTRNGNGKRWLLIALVVLGAFWLVNDAYRDGYYDALVQTGQVSRVRESELSYEGPHFPWGLLIVGGIAYVAWRKGVFDRFSGPGGGSGSNMGFGGPAIRGPRQIFDEWHREAHAAQRSAPPAAASSLVPQAPLTPPTPPPPSNAGSGNGVPTAAPGTPAPTPPAPDYWSTMPQAPAAPPAADANAASTALAPPPAPPASQPGHDGGATGPVLERW